MGIVYGLAVRQCGFRKVCPWSIPVTDRFPRHARPLRTVGVAIPCTGGGQQQLTALTVGAGIDGFIASNVALELGLKYLFLRPDVELDGHSQGATLDTRLPAGTARLLSLNNRLRATAHPD